MTDESTEPHETPTVPPAAPPRSESETVPPQPTFSIRTAPSATDDASVTSAPAVLPVIPDYEIVSKLGPQPKRRPGRAKRV